MLAWVGVLALLFLALRNAPLGQITSVLARLEGWQIVVLAGVNLFILFLMTARWSLVVRSLGGRVRLHHLLAYRLAGFGVSYFTPGPQFGGEPLQVHLLHRKGVPLHTAVSSVFLDRIIDLLANFTFLAIGIMTILFSGLAGSSSWNWGGLFIIVLPFFPLAHLVGLWLGKRPATFLAHWFENRLRRPGLGKMVGMITRSEAQIAAFLKDQPAAFAGVFGLSIITWLAMVLEFWLALHFLGMEARLVETISAQTAARLAYLLPLPGGLGALEASQALAMQMLGREATVGIAMSLLIRARDVLLALIGIWLGGFTYHAMIPGWKLSEERS